MFWICLVLVLFLLVGVLNAAPQFAARILPAAIRLDDGHNAAIVFHSRPDLSIFEKSVQPGAFEGGDPIMTSTHFNDEWETKSPQRLKSIDDIVVVAGYDPGQLDAPGMIRDLINNPDAVTVAWPEGSAQTQWAYLRRAEFSPLVKGEMPEVTLTIVVTNWDPFNCVEEGPVWVDGTGSCGPAAPATP